MWVGRSFLTVALLTFGRGASGSMTGAFLFAPRAMVLFAGRKEDSVGALGIRGIFKMGSLADEQSPS